MQIEIVLATYNGEKYLAEQIDSILAQTFTDWRLLIRDDGSTDGTCGIIAEYVRRYPKKIIEIDNGGKNLGSAGNFAELLLHTTAPYVMCSDQDDFWLMRKIENQMELMQRLEEKYGTDSPLLVYCDMTVSDEDLNETAPSYIREAGFDPLALGKFGEVLTMPALAGCTMLMNRTLLDLALPMPKEIMQHDYWLTLCTAAMGRYGFLAESQQLYRIHNENVSGIGDHTFDRPWRKIVNEVRRFSESRARSRHYAQRHYQQGVAFRNCYTDCLSSQKKKQLEGFLKLYSVPPVYRYYHMMKYGLYRFGFWRNVFLGLLPPRSQKFLQSPPEK